MELVLLAQLDNDQMLNRDHVKKWDLRLRLPLKKSCDPNAVYKFPTADTVDICLAKVKVEFNKPLPPAKMNKKMFIWMFDPLTKVC